MPRTGADDNDLFERRPFALGQAKNPCFIRMHGRLIPALIGEDAAGLAGGESEGEGPPARAWDSPIATDRDQPSPFSTAMAARAPLARFPENAPFTDLYCRTRIGGKQFDTGRGTQLHPAEAATSSGVAASAARHRPALGPAEEIS
jgi:hypothetical protein